MPKFSWDDFAGGVAQGGIAGLNSGTDLGRARNAAREDRLRTNLQFPDEIAEIGERRKELEGQSLTDKSLGALGDALPSTMREIDIPRKDRRLAQSDDSLKLLESLDEDDIAFAQRVKKQASKERMAESLERNLNSFQVYAGAVARLTRRAKELAAKAARAEANGDEEAAVALKEQYDTAAKMARQADNDRRTAIDALTQNGVDPDDIETLRRTTDWENSKQLIIRKYSGTNKTRKAGSRTK